MNVDRSTATLSLCAGIGGLDLGIQLAFQGTRTVCYVEGEAAACQILASRMAEGRMDQAPVWTDLRTFDGTPWRDRVDIIASGYPCQPFSFAGKGLADKDPRHLWPEVKRVIRQVGAGVVVLENVQGHIKRGLDKVLLDLHKLGFDAEWGVYSASQAGAPHRRNRVFILAYRRSGGLEILRRCRLLDGKRTAPRHHADRCIAPVADTDISRPQGRGRPQLEGAYQLPTWPPGPEDGWADTPPEFWPAVESKLRVLAHGFRSRVDELRALGNAVCPQQAALALTELTQIIEERHQDDNQ